MLNINDFPDWNESLAKYHTTNDSVAQTIFEIRLRAGRFLAAANEVQIAVGDPALGETPIPTDQVFAERMVVKLSDGGRYLAFFTTAAELEKAGGCGFHEVSFQELYDEVIDDKSKAGAVVNPTGQMLVLTRHELNRLMDEAADAGQNMTARELSYSFQSAYAWPPELQRAFAGALSRRSEVREAHMLARNVAWREDRPELLFLISFDGDSADLYPYLTEILAPYLSGVKFRFDRIPPDRLKQTRAVAPPVYLRPDISEKWEIVNSGKLPFPMFEDWDEEVRIFRTNLSGAEDLRVTATFESKMYVSYYYVPLDTRKNPKYTTHPELGKLLPVFTDWNELGKFFKPGARVMLCPYAGLYAMLEHNTQYSGIVINQGGDNLITTREHAANIHDRMNLPPGSCTA
jgi:hypothetical protein